MYHYALIIPLPDQIRTRLASFCYGLPQVHWVENENFHLTLRFFGPLSDMHLAEIQERLKLLFYTPFSIVLQGFGYHHVKKDRGSIWIGIVDQSKLLILKKEINSQLRGLSLPTAESSVPHITLGHCDRINPHKLGDYLTANNVYQSEPIEIRNCSLIRIQHTPKRVIYQIVEDYPASQPTTGIDY